MNQHSQDKPRDHRATATPTKLDGKHNLPQASQFNGCFSHAAVDLVYDPNLGARDLSVRLEMNLEDDVEAEMEEFSRLQRLVSLSRGTGP